MALFDDEEKLMAAHDGQQQDAEEDHPVDREESQYLGLKIAVCTLPVAFLFGAFGKFDMGLNAAICLSMNTIAVGICWDLRSRWWFWCVIVFMLALNAPLVVMIHWPDRWVSRTELLPVGLVDMLITVGVVRFVQHFIVRHKPPQEEEELESDAL